VGTVRSKKNVWAYVRQRTDHNIAFLHSAPRLIPASAGNPATLYPPVITRKIALYVGWRTVFCGAQ
jgi:hypothetical protein